MATTEVDKMTPKEYSRYILAQMIYAREFLHRYNLITEKENNKIHDRIKKYQDKLQIEITMPQLYSVYMEYDDNAVEDTSEE